MARGLAWTIFTPLSLLIICCSGQYNSLHLNLCFVFSLSVLLMILLTLHQHSIKKRNFLFPSCKYLEFSEPMLFIFIFILMKSSNKSWLFSCYFAGFSTSSNISVSYPRCNMGFSCLFQFRNSGGVSIWCKKKLCNLITHENNLFLEGKKYTPSQITAFDSLLNIGTPLIFIYTSGALHVHCTWKEHALLVW